MAAKPLARRVLTWLAVLAGLALFAACLLPIHFFGQPGTGARQTACLNNLKQLGVALQWYAQDHDERFPPAANWSAASWSYVRSQEAYSCPATPFRSGGGPPGYAFNSLLDGAALDLLANPTAAPLLFDSSAGVENAADPLTSWEPRHRDGGLVLFGDGHVAWSRDPPPADAGLQAAGGR